MDLVEFMTKVLALAARRLRRGTKIDTCLSVPPYTGNGTDLGSQEWCDVLFLQYGIEPPDLTPNCDGCGARLSISHALYFKKDDLVTTRHNKLHDGVADVYGKSLTP